jgi:hypothetical protein
VSLSVAAAAAALPKAVAEPATVTMTQAAVGLSLGAAAMGGSSGASDLQSMVVVMMARCRVTNADAAAPSAYSEGYKMLTPFALSDTASGALGGNAAAVGALATVQLVGYCFIRLVRKQVGIDALGQARFPGLLLQLAVNLHHSNLFASLRLLENSGMGMIAGAAGLLFSLVLPAGVALAALRVPRRFVLYSFADGSRFGAPLWRLVTPLGVTLPDATRRMASSVITSFISPSPLLPVMPFVSSAVSNVPALLPAGAPTWLCAGSMYFSAAVHLGLGLAMAVVRMHRFPSSCILTAAGLFLVAGLHAALASGFRGAIDGVVTAEAALSVVCLLNAVGILVLENKLNSDPSVTSSKVVWVVGDGGGHDDTSIDSPLLREASLVPSATAQGREMAVIVPTVQEPLSADVMILGDDLQAGGRESSSTSLPSTSHLLLVSPPLGQGLLGKVPLPTDLVIDPVVDAASSRDEDSESSFSSFSSPRDASVWQQGTEMASQVVGLPPIDEEDDLVRAYEKHHGDSRKPIPQSQPEVDLDFEL